MSFVEYRCVVETAESNSDEPEPWQPGNRFDVVPLDAAYRDPGDRAVSVLRIMKAIVA
jgi:hypothetical protein